MIHTVWPYLAVMLLAAGLFPAMERRFGWRVFNVLPPIVLTYLLVTALAVTGLWQINDEIKAAQSMLVSHMVPALLFLLMGGIGLYVAFGSFQMTSAKIKLQNTADAAAYSAAVLQARDYNFSAYTNRAMVANQVSAAQVVALKSWIDGPRPCCDA